jgi:transposase
MKRRPAKTRARKTIRPRKPVTPETPLTPYDPQAAAIDVGATSHWVAVPPETCAESVREFGVFTADLYAIADWLQACKVKRVALESTGVYWIPLFEVLEERKFEVRLVDARKVKNVSGRKSDLLDCQWLRQLHSYGLLAGAFRPAAEVLPLRAYLRQRQMLVQYAAKHIQHMQKALQQMNVRLDNVVTDITGLTGMKIIKAILAGERDARKLVEENRHGGCHTSAEVMMQSLVGNYRAEHLFALQQAVELYEEYRTKITACEMAIEEYLATLEPVTEAEMPEPPAGSGTKKAAEFGFEVRREMYRQIGVDLFRLPGFNEETVLRLLAETGRDLTRWPSEKHFASWLSVCPGTKKSGGKVLSSRTQPNRNRAAEALRRAAVSAGRTETELGAYFRRKRAHKGPAGAVTATAHKLAKLYYVLVKEGKEYMPEQAAQYEAKQQARAVAKLRKQAAALGYEVRAVAGTA